MQTLSEKSFKGYYKVTLIFLKKGKEIHFLLVS